MIDSKRQWRMACEWNVRTRILRSCTQSRHIFRILYGHITVALASLPRSIYYGSGVAAEQTIFPMTTTTRERILAWSEEHVFFPSFFIFIFYFPALFSRIAAKTSSISRSRSYTIDVTLAIFFNAIFFFFLLELLYAASLAKVMAGGPLMAFFFWSANHFLPSIPCRSYFLASPQGGMRRRVAKRNDDTERERSGK